jgi:cell division protein FtsB
MELTLYQAVERHIKGVLNGRTKIPLPAWKAEREELTAKRNRLNQRIYALKDEVKEVDKIHRNVYDILREETREAQRTRAQDVDR